MTQRFARKSPNIQLRFLGGLLGIGILALVAIGRCQTYVRSTTHEPLNDASIAVVFGLSQGLLSCSYSYEGLPARMRQFVLDEVQTENAATGHHVQAHVVIVSSCFTGGLVGGETTERLRYQIFHDNGDITPLRDTTSQTYASMVEATAALFNHGSQSTNVYLIGHSHGGWLAMEVANQWHSYANLRRLFTIDPISYIYCTQLHTIVSHLLKGVGNVIDPADPRCSRAPEDLAAAGPTIARHISGEWTNFYETENPLLHSGPIKDAHSNREMQYPNHAIGDFAHKLILFDDRVWQAIELQIKGDIAAAMN